MRTTDIKFMERVSFILRKVREDSNVSRSQMAKMIGKSQKTIQNWEDGYSFPDIVEMYEWFNILGINPLRYVLYLYLPHIFENISHDNTDAEIKEALIQYLTLVANPSEIRKLAFCIFGETGSSWNAQLEMLTAHNHLPLYHRINVARNIIDNYHICEGTDKLVATEYIHPDISILENATEKAMESVIGGKGGYVIDEIDDTKI